MIEDVFKVKTSKYIISHNINWQYLLRQRKISNFLDLNKIYKKRTSYYRMNFIFLVNGELGGGVVPP